MASTDSDMPAHDACSCEESALVTTGTSSTTSSTPPRPGLYEIRGLGAKRRLPHFDDLVFLAASLSRYPLEGYREKCTTKTVLGTRFAKKPIELEIPITIAGMSFGALSANVKEALGPRRHRAGHVDHHRRRRHDAGGARSRRRRSSISACRRATASIPTTCARPTRSKSSSARARSPAAAACCSARRSARACAKMRTLPGGHRPALGLPASRLDRADDLAIKINELREITDWEMPIYVKIGATRVFNDVKLARACGRRRRRGRRHAGRHGGDADGVHRARRHPDAGGGAAGGRGAGRAEHDRQGAADRLRRHPHRRRRRQGAGAGRRRGVDRPGRADGAGLQQRDLRAGRRSTSRRSTTIAKLGTAPGLLPSLPHRHVPGRRHDAGSRCWNSGSSPRSAPSACSNYLKTLNMELTTLARACGKSNVHHLEREDLVALTVEAAAMASVPLAGTTWIPGAARA